MILLYNWPGYSVNAFFTSTKFRRKLEFDVNGFTAGDVIQTRDTDTMGCLMLCLRIESCISALSLQGSCTMLNIRLCTGSRQDNDKQYYMKEGKWMYSILIKTSFAPLILISLYFKLPIPVKSGKMIWSSSNFQRMFNVHAPITVISVKDWKSWEMKLFPYTNHRFDPKMQNNHNFVFWKCISYHCVRFHKNFQKTSKGTIFSSTYPNEKSAKFAKFGCYPYRLNPSVVTTRKVNDALSLFWSAVKISNVSISLQKFWQKCEYSTSGAKLFEEYK